AKKLESITKDSLLIKKPADFKFLGEPQFNILKLTVNSTTDEFGNFAVFGEAEAKVFGIREKNIYDFLLAFLNQSNKKIDNLKTEYSNLNPNFEKGEISFTVKASGNLVYNLNLEELKNNILNKSLEEAKNIIKNLNELESAKILIKPRWIMTLPQNASKININIE
ncbi:MAG: hypothetical protein ACPL3E_01375, partial [Minisyncoccia bacterium]